MNPITNIDNRINLKNWLSNVKKNKLEIKKTKPPVMGVKFSVTNDLCVENFLSIKNLFFFDKKFKIKVIKNVNEITYISNINYTTLQKQHYTKTNWLLEYLIREGY